MYFVNPHLLRCCWRSMVYKSVAEGTAEAESGGEKMKKKKTFGTGDSRVIPNLSTGPARSTLASQFGMGYGACLLGMAECALPARTVPIYTSVPPNNNSLVHYISFLYFLYPLPPALYPTQLSLDVRCNLIRTQLFTSDHKITSPLLGSKCFKYQPEELF